MIPRGRVWGEGLLRRIWWLPPLFSKLKAALNMKQQRWIFCRCLILLFLSKIAFQRDYLATPTRQIRALVPWWISPIFGATESLRFRLLPFSSFVSARPKRLVEFQTGGLGKCFETGNFFLSVILVVWIALVEECIRRCEKLCNEMSENHQVLVGLELIRKAAFQCYF